MVWQGTDSERAAGRHNFVWDGTTAPASISSDGGQYR